MVSSSPEFSITKPGLHHRKRDKPLRTYGRQTSAPEAQTGPPSKKARISAERERQPQEKSASTLISANDSNKSNDDAAVAGALEGAAHKQDAEKTGESLKKGSILSYFKPASQPVPKADASSQPLQDSPPEEASSSPQSSPKQQPAKRKPRLLRIKASDQSSSSQDTKDNTVPQKRRGRPPLKSKIISNSSDQDTTTPSSSSSPSPTKQSTAIKPKKNKPFSPAVQTTLNISAQAAFSECKICNTVWNPLYPDDVKYHIKTHKAVLRAEKKRKMDEL
ncbi:hypothetical protein HDV63DRAFT_371407 [Trichoderma sp. SZMC 28014]